MQYSKIQKFLSGLLLFSIFFSLTFRVPFFDFKTFAGSAEFYNLVSIIVDESTYGAIEGKLKRYAEDISGVLDNTKVIILPTPVNTPAFNIASLNESLYYNGYKDLDDSIDFESKLVGTILVGNFNLPVVFDGEKSSRTILPFTDFEDKSYIYDHKVKNYIKNQNNLNGLKSEIWHGVISPNLGNNESNIDGLNKYFDKNHNFYQGTGDFKFSEGILNGDKRTGVKSTYDPFVFYYDQFRENKALNYTSYKGYEAYLDNKEDIVYSRFTKELANKISDMVLGEATNEVGGMINSLENKINTLGNNSPFSNISKDIIEGGTHGPDTSMSPDIQTRYITESMTNKFLEVFAKGIIGEMRAGIHNAGRYNKTGSEINADLIPYLVTVLDVVNDGIIKDVNNALEKEIDNLVINGLSRKIAIPLEIKEYKLEREDDSENVLNNKVYYDPECYDIDSNFLYGTNVIDIEYASECSIYRGNTKNGGKLVEANRGLNINLSLNDQKRINSNYCMSNLLDGSSLKGIWGGNSPLNIDREKAGKGITQLANYNVDASIEPLFNVGGSIQNKNTLNNPSPLDCFNNNLLSYQRKTLDFYDSFNGVGDGSLYGTGYTCNSEYVFQTSEGKDKWSCTYNNLNYKNDFNYRFEDFYKVNLENSISDINECEVEYIIKHKSGDNTYGIEEYYTKKRYLVSSTGALLEGYVCEESDLYKEYNFKLIPSYIMHKSPTAYELQEEINSAITQSLPVDKDRYIDFIGPKGNLLKIDYPALFRIKTGTGISVTFDTVMQQLDSVLNKKSNEINALIDFNNPSTLSGVDKDLFDILKNHSVDYPESNFDLVKFLKDKPNKTFTIGSETKTISYYDTLVFAIYWNNLGSVSAKYGAIFDNYLNDNTVSSDKYFLPQTKKQYEVTYLGVEGDARNMYIKMDPESKGENPYADILGKNLDLNSLLLGVNIGKGSIDSEEALFKCAPPDGVPIWEWIPAIMCRLEEMMPPSISLSDGSCGPSILDLLPEDEKAKLKVCNGDFNKNGINDCIEKKLDDNGKLYLEADSRKYFYNKTGELKAVLKDKKGRVITILNNTKVKFEIIKIEGASDLTKDISDSNKKIVFDINDKKKNNKEIIGNYVSFKDLAVPTVRGIAKYGIGLKSIDANIFLKASISIKDSEGEEKIFLDSDDLIIQIRGDRLFSSTYKIEKNNDNIINKPGIFSVKVNDKDNIFIADQNNGNIDSIKTIKGADEQLLIFIDNISDKGSKLSIEYPLNIKIFNDNDILIREVQLYKKDLKSPNGIIGIHKSGTYRVEIKDRLGNKAEQTIELLTEDVHTIETNLSTTYMDVGSNISTNFFTIYDKYRNVISGKFFKYKIEILGNGIVFLDNDSKIFEGSTFEGYKVFRLKSTNFTGTNKLKVSLYDSEDNLLIDKDRVIKVLNDIKIDVSLEGISPISVGNKKYKYLVKIKDENGVLLKDFTSRGYLNIPSIYGKTSGTYFNIVGGKGEVTFTTKTLAGENIGVFFQVEGITGSHRENIDILPGKPMKVDLILSKNKMEASLNESTDLIVELKDRYNNIVFNDNTTKTVLEIGDAYQNIITTNNSIKRINKGRDIYKISATLNPGVAYYKVSTIPALEKNSFIIEDKKGKIKVKGVGVNAGKIETFYFWNNSKIKGKKYNGIYTNLLGSNYGDIEEENYLAGSLLFNEGNRSLAVTSLLNNPFKYSDVLSLGKNGNLNIVSSSSDLTQDISISTNFDNDKLALDIYNNSLNIYIGKVLYNFDNNIDLIACDSDIESCINNEESSISVKSLSNDYNVVLNNNKINFLNNNGGSVFEITNSGTIIKNINVDYEYNKDNYGNYLSIYVKSGNKIIGEIGYSLINGKNDISRNKNVFNRKSLSLKNTILILLNTYSYGTYVAGNIENKKLLFYYNDPFKNNKALNDFSKSNTYGIENFINKANIGWSEGNKSLLEFAAGKTVGESVKNYMSFSVINLGDPVISLKKIKKKLPGKTIDRKFDSTIGKLISNDSDIISYDTFDYDNDNKKDILLIKNNKYLKLLENKGRNGNLIDKGNLGFIVDLGSTDLVKTGDFTGDHYDDIFFVNLEGKPYLLNNHSKDFSRFSLVENFGLEGKIVRAQVFDMDNDNISDIITLDEEGEINIFYGGGTSSIPNFTKLTISKGNGVKLNSEVRNDNSLIYFDGLYQPSSNPAKVEDIERALYIKYPYDPKSFKIDSDAILKGTQKISENSTSVYFMKSEYVISVGLGVEKKYIDKNKGFISSGDIVEVNITLINNGETKLKNIVFTEKVPKIFALDESSVDIIGIEKPHIQDGFLGYHFMIDDIDLSPGEEIIIKYKAKVRPIKYGYIEAGLFEKGEIGDDDFGDIIIKKDNTNCGDNIKLFRSLSNRSYQLGYKTPNCNEDKVKLPEKLEKNSIDIDGNGIPDYIDALTDTNNTTALQKYANEELDKMNADKDNDGIPDNEDFLEGSILDSLFTGTSNFEEGSLDGTVTIGLGEDLQKLDGKLDEVQNLLNGLNCSNASCFASPLNWAPLAPGGDPVLMGVPIGDGLKIDEGLPIISTMTGMPIYGPWGCASVPAFWPITPFDLAGACVGTLGAGGRLGIDSVTNYFRMFVTPTLTGGVGTAICFGGPASGMGNFLPRGVSPLLPSGNCVVTAKKMDSCDGDGSEGDVGSMGIPVYGGNGDFGLINGNCGTGDNKAEKEKTNEYVLEELIKNTYIDGNNNSNSQLEGISKELLNSGIFSEEPITPLFGDRDSDLSVTLDTSGDTGDYSDIIQVQMTRIGSFPNWLMDWVTRQIEEIVNKLTDFPTVFLILPDFTGVFDTSWGKTNGNTDKSDKNAITSNNKTIDNSFEKVNSGIKEAYEFIGSIPLIYIKQETINITIPWFSQTEIDKTILLREKTLNQREKEITKAKENWSLGKACNYLDTVKQRKCEEENGLGNVIKLNSNIDLDLDFLLDGLRKNLEIIKSYKQIPEKINKLITKKEAYLEQILCNIEIISNVLGGRIGKNGDRFKSWVELYILIKAILKSWQLLIDVFVDYESECHECKNERQDALDFEFKLIDFIIPKMPIIQWPKWPDIIIDLHNIRAGLIVSLPEFVIETKPLLLPSLSDLSLPEVPIFNLGADISLLDIPELPILPEVEIPELPDIPSLPIVNLPDLPPPPKLPKLLSSIEVVVDIIKLISKAMCMLKSIPIVPEWRAGDQIAFLTERSGYLGTDFAASAETMPEFSMPFIDAIKVTTYVNLEFDTDFIIELVNQIAMPVNNFTNDFINIFEIALPNLDFKNIIPTEINTTLNVGSEVSKKISEGNMIPIKEQLQGIRNELGSMGNKDILQNILAKKVGSDFKKLREVLKEGQNDLVDNLEFRQLINKALASKSITSNPKMTEILELWNTVNNISYSKENNLIKELKNSNREKFETLSDIINTEIIANRKLKSQLKQIGVSPIITKVGFNKENKIDLYNKNLEVFNNKFKESAKKIYNFDNSSNKELKESGNYLLSQIKTPLEKYSKGLKDTRKNKLLASVDAVNADKVTENACQGQADSPYKREYKGLYVIEDDTSYRLFDYLDELQGNEKINVVDIDGDSDDDILYFVNKKLYLKENLKNSNNHVNTGNRPIIIKANNNKFYNGSIFYEAINNAHEMGSDDRNINIGFTAPTNKNLSKFRLAFYNRVDKYINENNSLYRPEYIKKDIVDAISDIDNSTIIKNNSNNLYTNRQNLVYIKNVGRSLNGVSLTTKKLTDISIDIINGATVNITKGNRIYAGKDSFSINYIEEGIQKSITVLGKTNIEFNNDIIINGIGNGNNAYVKGYDSITYTGNAIKKYLPLFPGDKITYTGRNTATSSSSYVELEYFDSSELSLDFNKIDNWELFNLGIPTNEYSIRVSKENDYYYAKLLTFNNNINSTLSKQLLIAPQKEADMNAPELSLPSIKIPVYQEHITDLTDYIYEDSGITNIKDIIIDFDLRLDSDNDGDSKNDDDIDIVGSIYENQIEVLKNPAYLKLKFKPFDKLFKKKIGITLIDTNNNSGYYEVLLEVYSPVPTIQSYKEGLIKGGLVEENLTKEPINLYRFRGGIVTKLENTDGEILSLTDGGKYTFNVDNRGGGLKIYGSGLTQELAFINEKTGKINIKGYGFTTKVISSSDRENKSVFPKIILQQNNEDIYFEYLQMKGVNKINFVNSFENITDKGIYFKFTDLENYSYYTVPQGLDFNPGALSIYRTTTNTKDALFTIFTDGRVNTINDNDFDIKYDSYGDYIVLKLFDKADFNNREIGRILFVLNSEYIMKNTVNTQ